MVDSSLLVTTGPARRLASPIAPHLPHFTVSLPAAVNAAGVPQMPRQGGSTSQLLSAQLPFLYRFPCVSEALSLGDFVLTSPGGCWWPVTGQ